MLQYLINYDVGTESIEEIDLEYELDITDKTMLQGQINNVRKSYIGLIKIFDSIQGEYIQSKTELANRMRTFQMDYDNKIERADAISKDLVTINLQEKIEALRESLKTVENQLTFVKADMRILGNSMYVK